MALSALLLAVLGPPAQAVTTITPDAPRGAPWPRHVVDDAGRGADGVRLGDANGDGRLDVVSAWEESGRVRLYLHPGPEAVRRPWPAVTVGEVRSPEDAFLVDLNGNGALDVVSCSEGDERTVHVHWAPPPGPDGARLDPERWITQAIAATRDAGEWLYGASLRLRDDHPPDLVVGSKRRGATLSWLRPPSLASEVRAWTRATLRAAGWIMSIEPVDLDGDGDTDLVVSDREGRRAGVSWFEHVAGADPTAWPEHALAAAGDEVLFVDVADLDGDARPEVLAAVAPLAIVIARAPSEARRPWRTERVELASPHLGTAKAVRAGDLDGDGRADLVLACEQAHGARTGLLWLRATGNDGPSGWELRALGGTEGVKFDRLEVLDLDGDGRLDVLTTEEQAGSGGLGVVWFENPGSASAR